MHASHSAAAEHAHREWHVHSAKKHVALISSFEFSMGDSLRFRIMHSNGAFAMGNRMKNEMYAHGTMGHTRTHDVTSALVCRASVHIFLQFNQETGTSGDKKKTNFLSIFRSIDFRRTSLHLLVHLSVKCTPVSRSPSSMTKGLML